MVDNRKEQERAELHRTIWNIANDLRGSVDGWDFKQYVLGMLFYRYISENLTNYINEIQHAAGEAGFDYANMSDTEAEVARDEMIRTKGVFVLPSELFCNVKDRAKNDENLNETLEKIFNNIENSALGSESEDDFKGLFDDMDVNSNKLGGTVKERNERLVKLLNGVASMNLGDYKDNTIDAFGDAYEFLMGMYASNAGKSGGEYYTPQEVSELLTKITVVDKTEVNKVYDPACGSGSLLLKFAKILGKDKVRNGFYGQEINITTYNLCRINMFLHDIGYEKFDIAHGDTLKNPSPLHWDEEPFEAIVSNPPYSIKWEGDDNPLLINDPRFSPAGVLAPKAKADLAFIMHSLSWLASNGTAAIVCFPPIMSRGGAEQKIRKYLVDNNFVDCVIQLPNNLFFGTTTATCIMVLKKSKKDNSTLFIDATKECIKVTNNNKLTEKNINSILETFKARQDKDYISKLVPNSVVAENDYNLSVSTYVEQEDTREAIDIKELNNKLSRIFEQGAQLRAEIENITSKIETGTMDRLNELIATLCPEGVTFLPLEETLEYEQPTKYRVESTNYDDSFETPVLTAGQTFILGYTNETEGIYHASKDNPVIIFDDFTTSNKWVDFEFKVKSSAMKILTSRDSKRFNIRYLYHIMQTIKYVPVDHARQWIEKYSKFTIPVPPLEVQLEVAKILDNFINLTTELTTQLSEELIARKQQGEYYRDMLLTFKEKIS